MDLLAGLLLLGVGQGLFLTALLLARPRMRTPSNLFLAGLIAAVALSAADDLALRVGGYAMAPWAAGFGLVLLPLIGPLLRFHVEALLTPGDWVRARRHRRWLVSPAVGMILALSFLALPGPLRLALLADTTPPDNSPVVAGALLLVAIYTLAAVQQGMALRHAWRAARRSEATAPALASRLTWLRGLTGAAAICWLGYVASLAAGLVDHETAVGAQGWASVLYLLALYGLGVLGLARPDSLLPPPGEIVARILEPATKYARSALDADDAQRIAARIEALFRRDKPFLDSGLTLPKLARLVAASTNDTSQAINMALGTSFYDLVAAWRVEEAKRLLADPANDDTVLEICLAVGFNSKSVFNAAFKRLTGETPTAFRTSAQHPTAPASP